MPFDATDFEVTKVPAPVKPAIDNANLRAVRDLIANLPPHLFDMRVPHKGDCGTPACIYGWAKSIACHAGKYISPAKMADWMDVPHEEAADLFGMDADFIAPYWSSLRTNLRSGTKYNATPEQAVRVLDHLIATGETRWDLA